MADPYSVRMDGRICVVTGGSRGIGAEIVAAFADAEKLGALERLTSGIAAEIGSPLASIFSFVDVLAAMGKDELKREALETIRVHMDQIADTLQQLSRFSERSSAAVSSCRVNSLVEGTLALIQYDRKVQDITFVRDLAPLLPEIRTDKAALAQVIVNIILWAADAMPEGGTLTVRTGQREGRVVLEFEDTGVGISPEDRERIFESFTQVSPSRKPSGGVGLGLAIKERGARPRPARAHGPARRPRGRD